MEAGSDSPLSADVDDDELFEALSARLLEAHRLVARLDVPADEKASATRRLLVISDASKHDLGRAAARLERFLAELEQPGEAAGAP